MEKKSAAPECARCQRRVRVDLHVNTVDMAAQIGIHRCAMCGGPRVQHRGMVCPDCLGAMAVRR